MEKIFTLLAALLTTASVFAQSPEKMSYQAVIRDAGNNLVTSQIVGMQIQILQGSEFGAAVYVETQTPTSNANGLVSLEIGTGTVVMGNFSTIDWANGPYYLKTETDPAGGKTYTITGISQLLSVPYALHAKTAETVAGGITETDPVFTAWDKSTGISITESQINDLGTYLETETDPLFTAWDKDYADLINKPTTITTAQADAIVANTAKVGVTPGTAAGQMQYWNGSVWITVAPASSNAQTLYFIDNKPQWGPLVSATDVMNSSTGKIWMDRNLGASQVATSSTDVAAYGDLHQWGRGTDGHQIRTSGATTTLSNTNTPGHGNFITINTSPYDWRNPQNDNLWQGVNGINNPCPSGYRLPTAAEWEAERTSWSSNNAAGAFASPLKLSRAGSRGGFSSSVFEVGFVARYWSSSVVSIVSRYLYFSATNANLSTDYRSYGFSVRCLKD